MRKCPDCGATLERAQCDCGGVWCWCCGHVARDSRCDKCCEWCDDDKEQFHAHAMVRWLHGSDDPYEIGEGRKGR